VPAKVTYCPLLFVKVCWQHVVFYCDGFGFHVTRFPCVDFFFPCVSSVVYQIFKFFHPLEGTIINSHTLNSSCILISGRDQFHLYVLQKITKYLSVTLYPSRYKPEGRGFDLAMVLLEFLIDVIVPAALWTRFRLSF